MATIFHHVGSDQVGLERFQALPFLHHGDHVIACGPLGTDLGCQVNRGAIFNTSLFLVNERNQAMEMFQKNTTMFY